MDVQSHELHGVRVVEFPKTGDQLGNDLQAIEMISEAAAYRAEVILGDVSEHLSGSSAFRDFVRECNSGHQVWFLPRIEELEQKLLARAG